MGSRDHDALQGHVPGVESPASIGTMLPPVLPPSALQRERAWISAVALSCAIISVRVVITQNG
jgi:hypothetical protein